MPWNGSSASGLGAMALNRKRSADFGILAVDAAIFVVDDPRAVIDRREQHQCRLAAALLDPERGFDLLQVGRAHVELPELIRTLRLKAHRRDRAGDARMIETRSAQDAVDGRALEQTRRRPHQTFRRFDAVLLEQPDRARRREVAPLLVRGPDLERGDDLGVALHLGRGRRACRAVVGAPHRFRPGQLAERAIDRPDRHAICLGRTRDHLGAGRIARRQQRQAPAQVDQRLARRPLRAVSHGRGASAASSPAPRLPTWR